MRAIHPIMAFALLVSDLCGALVAPILPRPAYVGRLHGSRRK